MNCSKCSREVLMPFRCPYCGGQFCSEHRLPENHQCPNLIQARAHRYETASATVPNNASYDYKITFGNPSKIKGKVYMGHKEVKHLLIAALLVIGIGFSIALYGNYMQAFGWTWATMSIFAFILTVSFLVHEVMHKVIAQKRGMWAEFRLTTWGSLITLASVVLPIKLISPGAVMISGAARLEDIGKISIAGPSINMVLCAAFLGGSIMANSLEMYTLCVLAAFINAIIAVFNLIPFGILDGFKIFRWNRKVWITAFTVAVALATPSFLMAYGAI